MPPVPTPDDAASEHERVCAATDVAPGTLRAVTLSDGTRACLGNVRGTIFAVADRCPHEKVPLSDGELTARGTIVCARHGAEYDCVTGRSLRGPVRERGEHEAPLGRLAVYDVRVVAGDVCVRPPQLTF